jgi:hypothetical protein
MRQQTSAALWDDIGVDAARRTGEGGSDGRRAAVALT